MTRVLKHATFKPQALTLDSKDAHLYIYIDVCVYVYLTVYIPRGSYVVPFCGFGWETISFWFWVLRTSRTGFVFLKNPKYNIKRISENQEYDMRMMSK